MCTVTFLPGEGSNFILTSNRDEKVIRSRALPPQRLVIEHEHVWYPQDTHAQGTWIAASERGNVLCLLNGAFEPHKPAPPYRKSRGLVLLDFFRINDAERFAREYDFTGIEPFTLILVASRPNGKALFELRRDERETHFSEKNAEEHHIWSSVTLYTPETALQRKAWFTERIHRQPRLQREDILDFHTTGGTGDKRNDLVMDRDGVTRTVSITSVVRNEQALTMYYKDMTEKKEYESIIL